MRNKFIKFLKDTEIYNEEVFEYIKPKTVYLDHSEEATHFYGVFPIVDDNNIIKDIKLCVPKIKDDITVSINIHEYVHLLMVYRDLNKEYDVKTTHYNNLAKRYDYFKQLSAKLSKIDKSTLTLSNNHQGYWWSDISMED